ncbi:MAG TPA: hypothetical protein VK524_07705, partial [Polyangiaceae bacterium]|nr:hypothetical protein [Polyangiaceae bacterium]
TVFVWDGANDVFPPQTFTIDAAVRDTFGDAVSFDVQRREPQGDFVAAIDHKAEHVQILVADRDAKVIGTRGLTVTVDPVLCMNPERPRWTQDSRAPAFLLSCPKMGTVLKVTPDLDDLSPP